MGTRKNNGRVVSNTLNYWRYLCRMKIDSGHYKQFQSVLLHIKGLVNNTRFHFMI